MSSLIKSRSGLPPSMGTKRILWRDIAASWALCLALLSMLGTAEFLSDAHNVAIGSEHALIGAEQP